MESSRGCMPPCLHRIWKDSRTMRIAGRRIQIVGSSASDTNDQSLHYAHELVVSLVRLLSKEGATFILSVGDEPLARPDDPSSPSIIFDWTALATVSECLKEGIAHPKGLQGRLITSVVTQKSLSKIPASRQTLWKGLETVDAVKLEFANPGWSSGAVRRTRQAELGDILIALSGGEGTEHLAQLYALVGKPVIPLDLALGSSKGDGSGGATRLAKEALAHPDRFVRASNPDSAALLFARLATNDGRTEPARVAQAVVDLIHALESPRAFYVRLMNTKVAEYTAVEDFFRQVVDPVVERLGFTPLQVDRGKNTHAWINEAIFDGLHYSSVAVVDLTGLRNNCFMELGYALGHAQPVMITAMEGTKLPFDAEMIETHVWSPLSDQQQRIDAFQAYWQRNSERPPLVKPRGLL
jgi:nucleoside 2-deoxyribosyltransferase